MSADLRALLDRLDTALAAATSGPWEVEHVEDELKVTAGTARTTWTEHDGFRMGTPPSSWTTTDLIYEHELEEWDVDGDSDDGQRLADAALIVAAVNALPGLLAAVRAVADVLDAADERTRAALPPNAAEHLVAQGAHTVRVSDLDTALAAAPTEGDAPA